MPVPSTVVYFDLETTGRLPDQHEIIQIAAIAVQNRETIAEIELKLQFDLARAEPEALAMNSYDEVAWQQALKPQAALRQFSAFLSDFASVEKVSRRTGNTYYVAKLAGHNAGHFDMPFLNTAFRRYNMFLPADWRALDTLDMADWLVFHGLMDPPSMKLTDLCQYFGAPIVDAHDALADVRGTVMIAHHMMTLIGLQPDAAEMDTAVLDDAQLPDPPAPEPETPAEPELPAPTPLPTPTETEIPDTWEAPPNPDEDDRQMLLF